MGATASRIGGNLMVHPQPLFRYLDTLPTRRTDSGGHGTSWIDWNHRVADLYDDEREQQ